MISFDSATGQVRNDTAATSSTSSAAAATGTPGMPELGQKDFLTLMLAQLQSQDPLNPMDNSQFVAQLATFSQVSGLEKINTSIESMASGMTDFRVSSASNMLGRQVLVPGNVARADAEGAVHGAVDLTEDATSVVVNYSNGTTGELLQSVPYGAQAKGNMTFDWDGVPDDLAASRAPIRVSVSVTTASGTRVVDPQVYARVTSATADGTDLTLQVEDYGAMNALEVNSIR